MKKYQQLLNFARDSARKGRISSAEFYLREAKVYATEARIKLPNATVEEIREVAYRSRITALLASARERAQASSNVVAQSILRDAEKYAAKGGIDITKDVKEIKESLKRKR